MSYQVLARKWRPHFFAEMIGQDHVVRALSNALDQNRLHHAYLFSGTRGVGKTTVARIFAKSLNCERGLGALPCGECTACTEIDEGRFIDLIEVDAASRTGVDDTRELMDNVSYAPTRARYKVYLIDEVHMFSKSSFNALLKTLEEPPPHVKFLLATTDPQKLLPTVLSRCLQFHLKRVPSDTIEAHVRYILDAESLGAEASAVARIARAADGSVRDALSLLDQAIAFARDDLMLADVDAMLGGVSHERIYALLEAVLAGDAQSIFTQLAELDDYAPDYYSLSSDLLSLLHQIAIIQAVPDAARESIADLERVRGFAHAISTEDVQLYYQIVLTGRRDMPHTPDERDAFEMTLLRMIAFRPVDIVSDLDTSMGAIAEGNTPKLALAAEPEPDVASGDKSAIAPVASAPVDIALPSSLPSVQEGDGVNSRQQWVSPVDRPTEPDAVAVGLPSQWRSSDWPDISRRLGLQGMYGQLVAHCSLLSAEDHRVVLVLAEEHRHLNNDKLLDRVRQALSDLCGSPIALDLSVGVPIGETPAQRAACEENERRTRAEQSITEDPVVQDIRRRFDASLAIDDIELLC